MNAQTHTAHINIQYANINGISLQLDVYTPNNQTAPTPLIVWVHGGGWQNGSRTLSPNGFQRRQANRGYAVASVSYRLSGVAKFPAQIHDVKTAVRWLKANAATYNIDPSRVGAWGSSAGGHLVALLATSSVLGALEDKSTGNANQNSKVQAVVDWFGPTDLLQMDAQDICGGPGGGHNSANSPESNLVGCPIQICRAKSRRPNPIRYIDPAFDYPPFLIMHGTNDCSVPPGQSQILHNGLTVNGDSSQIKMVEGEGHGGPLFTTPENQALVDAFWDTKLMNAARENKNAAEMFLIFQRPQ